MQGELLKFIEGEVEAEKVDVKRRNCLVCRKSTLQILYYIYPIQIHGVPGIWRTLPALIDAYLARKHNKFRPIYPLFLFECQNCHSSEKEASSKMSENKEKYGWRVFGGFKKGIIKKKFKVIKSVD